MNATPLVQLTGWKTTALRDPVDGSPLVSLSDDELATRLGRDGRVLDLAQEEHYWNHIPRDEMARLLSRTAEVGWAQAMDEVFLPRVDAYTFQYATDERRADWFPLCRGGEGLSIADIGAGWGAVTTALARQGHRVYALDTNLETLEFVSRKTTQEGLGGRVFPVRVDPLESSALPFADDSLDLVVLNGVLEWVGAATNVGSPRDAQRFALSEARRVLRSEGQLYLAIESRFGLSMLLGGEDHPGTRFTSVMPRWMATWTTKRAGKGPYRTWTYSYGALRRLLRQAGFVQTRFYAPFPDYRFPHSIVPLADGELFRNTIVRPGLSRGHARLLQASSWLGLHRDAVSHFSVVAS